FDTGRIDRGDGDSFFLELLRGLFRDLGHVAESEDRHVASVLYHFSFADLEQLRGRLRHGAGARAARITNRNRPAVVVRDGPEHVDELVFILRLHVDEVRDVTEVADVE